MNTPIIPIPTACRRIVYGLLVAVLVLAAGCSGDDSLDLPTDKAPSGGYAHSCRLYLEAAPPSFDAGGAHRSTADSSMWADAACIWLSFQVGDRRIDGKAIYSAASDDWTLYYNGNIPQGTASTCRAYHFRGSLGTSGSIYLLTSATAVYADMAAPFSMESGGMRVRASLMPQTGRLRFRGTAGRSLRLSGLHRYSAYDPATGSLTATSDPCDLTVGADGYTPYVYAYFPSSQRQMAVAYDDLRFATVCAHPIMDLGTSGYMDLPTEDRHNGWDMKRVSVPEVGNVSVSAIGVYGATFAATLVADGNCTVTDAGFCMSTAPGATIDDLRLSAGTSLPSGATLHVVTSALQEATTYYVRAYAVNELGTAYGTETTFTTLAITPPDVSEVTVTRIASSVADVEATVLSAGHGTLTDAGFVYATHGSPTMADSRQSVGANTALRATLRSLQPLTTYYVRAYATNEKGTAYGPVLTLTTKEKPKDSEIDADGFEGENNWD